MSEYKKTALVLGAGGFIGSHMVKRLRSEGYWVRGVDLKYPEFSSHQANEFITKSLQRILNIPDDKVFNEMHGTGNTSSSSIPIVLSKNFNKLSSKKNVLLIGFGGGLSWGVCLIKRSK